MDIFKIMSSLTHLNKVAFITGGTSGIGRATAFALAQAGAKIVVTGRREVEGSEVVGEIEKSGGQAIFVKTDVTKEKDIEVAIAQTMERFGRLDIAFNNAGAPEFPSPLTEKTDADYDRIMDTNVRSIIYSLKHEIPAMLQNGGGSIVNTSSIAGLVGMGGIPIYIASKHAVIGITKSVALEYAKQGIRVNAIAPAAIETEMFNRFADTEEKRAHFANLHPVGRFGQSSETAAAVLYLTSDLAGFVTGITLPIDGGFTAQ